MSYRIKVPPKSTPLDEAHLLGGMDRLTLTLERNRVPVLAAAVVVVLTAIIVAGVLWYDARNADQANELHRLALLAYYDKPAEQPDKQNASLKKSVELLTQIVDQYPRTPVAELALYELGNALVQGNELAGGIAAYQRYLATYGANTQLAAMVYQRLGYAYLLKGETEQAIKAFSASLDVPAALNKDQVLFELGKLEESQSRPEGALARYQDLMKNYPNSPFNGEAAVRIKALEAKANPPVSTPPGTSPTPPPAVKK